MLLDVKRARDRSQGRERRQMQREALNISAIRQPQDRAIRYTDMRSAMAEEGILRLLLLDISLADRCQDLPAEDFSSPFLGKVYRLLLAGRAGGNGMSLNALSGECTAEEMSHLTTLLQKPESLAYADKSLPDYIRVIDRKSVV